jgi:KDO2-lipid IV(A) lauroyltransferase
VVADDWLAWAIQHRRAHAGLRMLYRHRAALGAVRLLRRGEALLLLGDDASGQPPRTHLVRFCDHRARLPAGVAGLARAAQASVLPFAVVPLGPRRWRVIIDPPIEPPRSASAEPALLQQVADRWTALIRAHPQQWAASFPIAWDVAS